LGKRNQPDRFILRLGNFVSSHTIFRHESTSNGFVHQPHFNRSVA
jgi:hypothetical protein